VGLTKALGVVFLAALEIGGAYGDASAEVRSIEETSLIVDIEVEILASATAVVAHLEFDDDPALALPLLDRGGGVFGITTELERKNYVVVFEAVGQDLARPVFLTDLGADLNPDDGDSGGSEPTPDDSISDQTRQMGWLALGLGAASLSALAFWVLGGRDKKATSDEEE